MITPLGIKPEVFFAGMGWMSKHSTAADRVVRRIQRELRAGGSPQVARSAQRFFKDPIISYGWRTAKLRRYVRTLRREILQSDACLLFPVAEALFRRESNEEKHVAVGLLASSVKKFGGREFRRLAKWVPRIKNWDHCDDLCINLLGPLIAADESRVAAALRWATAKSRWQKRAAVVALVVAARRAIYSPQVFLICDLLLQDEDDMVQKGVGWLLREVGKKSPQRALSYLLRVRNRAPRLVLRTACEKLPQAQRRRVLRTALRKKVLRRSESQVKADSTGGRAQAVASLRSGFGSVVPARLTPARRLHP